MSKIISMAFTLMALAVPLLGGVLEQSNAPDTILFRNGDLLYGKLLDVDGQAAVHWSQPDATGPISFKPDGIAEIDFPPTTNFNPGFTNDCRLLMANGDTLVGDFVSCDKDAIVLQTWYAGKIRLPRAKAQSLGFIPHSPAIFNGITGMDGWTQATAAGIPGETGKWAYRNGAFYASKPASIARNLKLPDVAEIQFDLAWKGSLNLAVALYTDSLQPILVTAKDQAPEFGAFYSLRFQNSFSFSVDCWPIKKDERLRSLGQLFLPALNDRHRLHVDLRCSKPQHKIALYLDDTLVKEWDDPEGFVAQGTGVRFVQNPGSVLKLDNLRVTQWDGVFTDTSGEEPDTTHDLFWAGNQPKVSGTIDSITNAKLTAHTTNGVVEVPIEKLQAITFAHRSIDPMPIQSGMVRGTFYDGGTTTFILESWRPNQMVVRSPDFGEVKIDPAAFDRLQFLVPEKKATDSPKS